MGYRAVFIATGAGLPKFMNIPGEHLGGVYSANEFLTRINLMKAYDPQHFDSPVCNCAGRNVAVIGGGNTAKDAFRCAVRLGAKNAYIVYRRSEAEMPARAEELRHAKDEGVQFMTLHNPVAFLGDEHGLLPGVRLQKMRLSEQYESGRRRPVAVPGSEFHMPIDVVVIAIGTGANPLVPSTTPDVQTNRWGYIVADPRTLRTAKHGVFAGGDIVSGSATVILAMGAGRLAARSIDMYLTTGIW
jgi:glutamate synthase (NADPH/NADH) small chain